MPSRPIKPVGGIKEKILAAHCAGLKTVMLPRRNEPDLEDVPRDLRETLTLIFVDTAEEVLEHALEPAKPTTRDDELAGSRVGPRQAWVQDAIGSLP